MKLSDKAKSIISSVAPVLGSTLGGPLGGLAGNVLAKALGVDARDPRAAEDAIVSQSPEAIAKIRLAEIELEKAAQANDIDLERINVQDRANAREREIKLGDWTPAVLAYGVTLGFFGVLLFILNYGVPKEGGEALLVMLGSLGTAWIGITTYYYGSSAGSKNKTDLLATLRK